MGSIIVVVVKILSSYFLQIPFTPDNDVIGTFSPNIFRSLPDLGLRSEDGGRLRIVFRLFEENSGPI